MTPWEAFEKELEIAGYSLCRCPAGVTNADNALTFTHSPETGAHCIYTTKTIHIGHAHGPIEAGIAGLHELGHVATTIPWGPKSCFEKFVDEEKAWDWAQVHMPPGYSEQFEAVKRKNLGSYGRNMCPLCILEYYEKMGRWPEMDMDDIFVTQVLDWPKLPKLDWDKA